MRILITGGSGLLGLNWALETRRSHDVVLGLHQREVAMEGTTVVRLAVDDEVSLHQSLLAAAPDLVVHTAGLTSVERSEANPDGAQRANSDLARWVASFCQRHERGLIHVSTDHLFDGREPLATELTPRKPLNVYARTKADAEDAMLDVCPRALVVRTNFYGWGPSYRKSFSDWLIDSLRTEQKVNVFRDVFYTPILMSELVATAMELHRVGAAGCFHVAGPERISKYDFALLLARVFALDETLVVPSDFKSSTNLVRRPLDMSLDSSRAQSLLGTQPRSVVDQLQALFDQECSGHVSCITRL